jgi:hypothetical protein
MIDRYINQRKNKLMSGLTQLNLTPAYDDPTQTFSDLISGAPSISGMTDLFSQKTIDDVLAGNRQIDFFSKIDPNLAPGLATKGLVGFANFVGPKMGGPVTKEKLESLLSEINTLEGIDPSKTSSKDLMQEFAPNMKSLQDDGSYKKASELPTPKIKLGDKIEDRVNLIKKTDGGVGPQTSLSLRMNLLNDLVKDGTITKKQYEDALLKGSAFVEEDGYRVRLGPFDFTGRGGEKITKMIDKYEDYDNYAMGGEVPVRKNQGGVMELDYRETGGFVPVGIKERADDVPAMLSKNEEVSEMVMLKKALKSYMVS